MKYIILLLLLLLLIFKILNKVESFNNKYNFEDSIKNYSSNNLISRIVKITRNDYYEKNKFIPKGNIIHILKENLVFFIDNDLNKLNKKIKLNILDHPFRSTDKSVYNYKDFLYNKNILEVKCEDWGDKLNKKLQIIPIGFDSKSFINGLQKKMIQISKSQKTINNKPLKILCNAHLSKYKKPISGNYNQRQELFDKLKNNELVDFWREKKNIVEMWRLHDNYSFELCPEGNGLDTHRFYEALYLNTIPIVKKNSLESMYKKFPCIIVNDWKDITEKNLKEWKKQLAKRVENEKYKLRKDYWLD